jgi:uncharacterized protein (TIGR02266 family)
MNSAHAVERRLFARCPLRTRVVFEDEFGEGLFFVYSRDISMGGIFLASSIPVRIGTMLFLSLTVPPYKRPIRITGQVVRVIEDSNKQTQGMGVRFIGLSDAAQEKLNKFFSQTKKRS